MPVFLTVLRYTVIAAAMAVPVWVVLLHPRRQHPALARLRQFRYAHRGLHDKPRIPENSLAAFRAAAEHGFGAELDVHLTKDGRLAVIHDSSLQRTCGADGIVEELTAAELAQFRLEDTDEPIPFLEDVLPLFEGKAPLIVELKAYRGNHAALTDAALECLDRFSAEYCVESFDPRCVVHLRKRRPEIVRGQLTENFLKSGGDLSLLQRLAMTYLLFHPAAQPDFVACRFEDRGMIANRIACRLWGTQAVSWTIRTPQELQTAEADGNVVIFEQFIPEKEKS